MWNQRKCCFAVYLFACSGLSLASAVSGQGSWEVRLLARDLNGDTVTYAFYDTQRGITWLADTRGGAGSQYDDTGGYVGTDKDGRMNWQHAADWVSNLNLHGATTWRLPTMVDLGELGCTQLGASCTYGADPETSEMHHMFLQLLGNTATYNALGQLQPNSGFSNTGPLSFDWSENVPHELIYWTGLTYALDPSRAWVYSFTNGYQDVHDKSAAFYVWAVHDGDVGLVPEPDSYLLALTALATIALARKIRKDPAAPR